MITRVNFLKNESNFLSQIEFQNYKGLSLKAISKIEQFDLEFLKSNEAKEVYKFTTSFDTDPEIAMKVGQSNFKLDKYNEQFSNFIKNVGFSLPSIINDIYSTVSEDVRSEDYMNDLVKRHNKNGITWIIKIDLIY